MSSASATRARTAATSSAVGSTHGPVTQAHGVLGRRADAGAAPDVEAEVVVVAAGADERGGAEVGLLLEAEDVAVEREASVDVADVQVQVAHLRPSRSCGAGASPSIGGEQGAEVQRRRGRASSRGPRARPSSSRSAASSMPLPSGSGR